MPNKITLWRNKWLLQTPFQKFLTAGSIVMGATLILVACAQYKCMSDAAERMRTWTKVVAKVVRMEQVPIHSHRPITGDNVDYLKKATVYFKSADGVPQEGFLFGHDLTPGDSVTVLYDSHRSYAAFVNPYNGARSVYFPTDFADADAGVLFAIELLGGILFLAYAAYRVFLLTAVGKQPVQKPR
jgi:hypothetical protein